MMKFFWLKDFGGDFLRGQEPFHTERQGTIQRLCSGLLNFLGSGSSLIGLFFGLRIWPYSHLCYYYS